MNAIAEDTPAVTLDEIASVYSQAVPPRVIAEYLNREVADEDAIQAEREKFRLFMLDTARADGLIFASQKEAWEIYSWDWDEWIGQKDYSLEPSQSPEGLYWQEHMYVALDEQTRPDNIDPETGGQM